MNVCEIFYSIQGEGIEVGSPTLFVRLAGCNLYCSWCDTKYSWVDSKVWGLSELTDEIVSRAIINDSNIETLCITGGEPLVQAKELERLLRLLEPYDFHISIETNGTIWPSYDLQKLVSFWSISPKLRSSGQQLDEDVIVNYNRSDVKLQFKFVICNQEDFNQLIELLDKKDRISPWRNIVVQPDGTKCTLEVYVERLQWLTELVIESRRNIRVIPQVHRIIWGQKRGV